MVTDGRIRRDFIAAMLEFHCRIYLIIEEAVDEEIPHRIRQIVCKIVEECNGIPMWE